MINIKICYRTNDSVSSVVVQGHAKESVSVAIYALMEACGNELIELKSAKTIMDKDGLYNIFDIRQNKQAIAIAGTLVKGLETMQRKNPFAVSILNLYA